MYQQYHQKRQFFPNCLFDQRIDQNYRHAHLGQRFYQIHHLNHLALDQRVDQIHHLQVGQRIDQIHLDLYMYHYRQTDQIHQVLYMYHNRQIHT